MFKAGILKKRIVIRCTCLIAKLLRTITINTLLTTWMKKGSCILTCTYRLQRSMRALRRAMHGIVAKELGVINEALR